MLKNRLLDTPDLQGREFEKQKFFHCQFRGIMRFTSFLGCTFDTCDFAGADLEDSTFENCNFPGSKLSQLDFSRTFFRHCDFSKGIYIGTHFIQRDNNHKAAHFNLSNTKFNQADLTQAVFGLADLSWSEFIGANLKLAVFDKCKLHHTDFSAATIEGTAFPDCSIKQAKLDFDGFVSFGRSHGFTTD